MGNAFRASFDAAFLAKLGWREEHLGITVIFPLVVSLVTVCLIRSMLDIARLACLTLGFMLILFASVAHIILASARDVRGTQDESILNFTEEDLNYWLGVGGAFVLGAVISYIWN